MPLDTIPFKEVLATMDTGAAFSIGVRTFDKKKETGGEWISLPECVKHNYLTAAERMEQKRAGTKQVLHKDPRHYENSTRNIKVVSSGKIIKLHIRLIRQFNNKTVL
jgi:hypothetical protein